MTVSRPHSQFPWLKARFQGVAGPWNDIGTQVKFYGRTLPALTEIKNEVLPADRRARLAPIFFAGALIGLGATLIKTKPRFGNVPNPSQFGDMPRRKGWRRAAQKSRDGVATFAPSNVTDSLGRSLLLGGAALLVARVLDEAAGRNGK